MQDILNDTVVMILLTTAIIILFAASYMAVLFVSNKKIVEEQQKTIDEVRKSEQRYKALFENSLAGMIKFSISPWIVFDANQAILDLFNANTVYDLQQRLAELDPETIQKIENTLKKHGIIDALEIVFDTKSGIKRRFLFSARKETTENWIHGVMVLMTSEKKIG